MTESQPIGGIIDNGEHRLNIRVYYEDTDFTGLVYHANYLKFFERGRSDYLRLLGVHHAELKAHEDQLAFAVIHIDIRYLAPAGIDDLITVRTRLLKAKGALFVIAQSCECAGVTLCTGTVKVACIDGKGKAARLPKRFSDALSGAISA